MKLLKALFFFTTTAANAHTVCTRVDDTVNYPYKVHQLNEPLDSGEIYLAEYDVYNNGYLYIKIHEIPSYVNNNVLKDRKGNPIPAADISEHIGFYVESSGEVVEISTDLSVITPLPKSDPSSTTNRYDMTMYYMLKRDVRNYSNDPFEITLRFEIGCDDS